MYRTVVVTEATAPHVIDRALNTYADQGFEIIYVVPQGQNVLIVMEKKS